MASEYTFKDSFEENQIFVLAFLEELTKYCKSIKNSDTKIVVNKDELEEYRKDHSANAIILTFEYHTSDRSYSDLLFDMYVSPEGFAFALLGGMETIGFDFEKDMTLSYVVKQAKFTIDALLNGQIFMQITHKNYKVFSVETILQNKDKSYKVLSTKGLGYPWRIKDEDTELSVVRNTHNGVILKQPPKDLYLIEKYEDGVVKKFGRDITEVPSKPLYKKDFVILLNKLQNELVADNSYENTKFVIYKRWETWMFAILGLIILYFGNVLLAIGASAVSAAVWLRPWILRNKRGNDIVQKKLLSITSDISLTAIGYSLALVTLFLKDSILLANQQPESFLSAGVFHKELYIAIIVAILVFIALSVIGMQRWLFLQLVLIISSFVYFTYLAEKYFDTETYINSTQEVVSGWLLALSIIIMLGSLIYSFIQNRTKK